MNQLARRLSRLPTLSDRALKIYLVEKGLSVVPSAREELLKLAQLELAKELASAAGQLASLTGQARAAERGRLGLPPEEDPVVDVFDVRPPVHKAKHGASAYCRARILEGGSNSEISAELVAELGLEERLARTYPGWNRFKMWNKGFRLTATGRPLMDPLLQK